MATFGPLANCLARKVGQQSFRLFDDGHQDEQPVVTAMFDVLPSDRITRVVIHVFREADHVHGPDCLELPGVPGYRACVRLSSD